MNTNKTRAVLLLCGLALAGNVFASFQPSFATVNGSFYDLNASTANPDFHLANLGVFNIVLGNSLLLGGELNVTGGNVEFARLGWGVYDTSDNSLAVAFSETPATYNSSPDGNDRWLIQGSDRPNVLSTLGNGTYRIHVYLHGDYNGGDFNFYANNGGIDYQATFSVIPEPSSMLMMGLAGFAAGGMAVLKRRKRS